jgi:hypothetical protein
MSNETASPQPQGNWFIKFLWHLLDVYHELKPCRFVFLVAIIGAAIFLCVEQGIEVLRALAERGALTGATGKCRVLAFAVGLLLWSLSNWYSARVLLYFDFPATQAWHPPREGFWKWFHLWLRHNVPRLLGVTPMLIVGWSFLSARRSYEDHSPAWLLYFALLSIAGAVALYLFFIVRRHWIERGKGSEKKAEQASVGASVGKQYRRLNELERESLIVLGVMVVISITLSILFMVDPVYFAGGIGTVPS